MSLNKSEVYPDCWELATAIRPDTAQILKLVRSTSGVSLTEIIRRAMACYDFAANTEFGGGKLWLEDENAAHQLTPDKLPGQEAIHFVALSVNVNQEQANLLRNLEAIKGLGQGAVIDLAAHLYSNLVDASILSGRILSVMPDSVIEISLLD